MSDEGEVDRRGLFEAVEYIAGHRPLFIASIILFSALTALLSGIGIGFIVPIVELAQSDGGAGSGGGLTGLFTSVYAIVGVALTLETAVLGVGLVITAQHVLSFLTAYYRVIAQTDIMRTLRLQAAKGAIEARVSYYDSHGSDEVLNAIVTESNYAGGFLKNGVELLQSVLVMLVYVGVAFYLAPELTALTAGVFLLVALGVRFGFGSGYDAGERVADANEAVQEAVQSSTQGIRAVKLFGLGDDFYERIVEAVDSHVSAIIRLQRNRTAFEQFHRLASALTVFGLLYIGLAVLTVPLANLAAFLFAIFRLAPQVTSINDIFYRAEGDLPHVTRMIEFAGTLENSAEPGVDTDAAVPLPTQVHDVALKNVTFAYETNEPVLQEISFAVERPEFVALVGQSGSGKSTVVSLLARLYEPDSGRITVNGTPINQVDLGEWRSQLAVVRQDPYVFNDTLRFNLRVGNSDASRAAVERACEIAQVTEFLDDLPDGYDTNLGDDGVRLSGGQRQRVAIARALLRDANVLVFDEATSDLDTRLERKVHRAIEEMDREVVTVVIAHRLSTVIDADRIHVFEDGQVVETGTHDELVESGGLYADLYAVQAGA